MKKPLLRKAYISVAFFLTLSACSQQHFVKINPGLPVSQSNLGLNTTLVLKIIDSRPRNLISKWKGTYSIRSFRISLKQDLSEVLHTKIATGLQKKGFKTKRFPSENMQVLRVEILQLKSIYDEDTPRRGVKVDATLQAHCDNKGQTYKKNYRERLTRTPIIPASFPNETLVNAALSGTLKKLFLDNRLLNCLAN
jgi:uncharacterized lipoprotein YajG